MSKKSRSRSHKSKTYKVGINYFHLKFRMKMTTNKKLELLNPSLTNTGTNLGISQSHMKMKRALLSHANQCS